MKTKPILLSLVLFASLGLAGCNEQATLEYQTQYRAIVPPDTLYECPAKPARPTGVITDRKVAQFLVKLDSAHSICSHSLQALKAFAAQAQLAIEQN